VKTSIIVRWLVACLHIVAGGLLVVGCWGCTYHVGCACRPCMVVSLVEAHRVVMLQAHMLGWMLVLLPLSDSQVDVHLG